MRSCELALTLQANKPEVPDMAGLAASEVQRLVASRSMAGRWLKGQETAEHELLFFRRDHMLITETIYMIYAIVHRGQCGADRLNLHSELNAWL